MTWIIWLLLSIFHPEYAHAQCSGVFSPFYICGNPTASPAPPGPNPTIVFSSAVAVPSTTTSGDIVTWGNNVGGQLYDPGLTTGTAGHKIPFLDGANTFSGTTSFSSATTFTNITSFVGGTTFNSLNTFTGATSIFSTLFTSGTTTISGPITTGFVSVGTLNFFWTFSASFANGGANVEKHNRMFVGEATKNNTGDDSAGPFSWVETLIGGLVASSQMPVGNTVGEIGVTGYSRASDQTTANGTHAQNTLGVVGFGYNDDSGGTGATVVQGMTPIAAVKSNAVGVTTAVQADVNAVTSQATLTPGGSAAGASLTLGVLITAGSYPTLSASNASAAMDIGIGRAGGPTFNAGIVFLTGSVTSTSAALGTFPRMIELPATGGITWWNGSTEVGGFFMDVNGVLNIATQATNGIKINNTLGATCSAGSVNLSTITVSNGIVTHC